jgi:hypothetical protein
MSDDQSRPCKAILIDPAEAEIREVDHDGTLEGIYRLLSSPWHPVEIIEALRIGRGDVIYFDENGLLHEPIVPHWFAWKGFDQPLAGRGLILGTSAEGESITPKATVEQVRTKVVHLARLGETLIGLDGKQAVGFKIPTPHAEVIFPYPVPKSEQN